MLLLLDRDGTLMDDVGYPNDPDTVRLIPGAAAAVRELVQRGYRPAVVSNQSGLARGRITPGQAQAVHERFVQLFEAESGVRLPCFYCPHGPDDGCECRKPEIGLLRTAATALGHHDTGAVMIGDKLADVEAGKRFGAVSILFAPRSWQTTFEGTPDFLARTWPEIVNFLLQREARHVPH